MLHKHHLRRGSSSLLELEAAEYFKLDLSQMNLSCLSGTQTFSQSETGPHHPRSSTVGLGTSQSVAMPTRATARSSRASTGGRPSGPQENQRHRHNASRHQPSTSRVVGAGSEKTRQVRSKPSALAKSRGAASRNLNETGESSRRKYTPNETTAKKDSRGVPPSNRMVLTPQLQQPSVIVGSSTTSTNSLPSITSSPSVSPSLVCPHLSLDDILAFRQGASGSPHTIGLCPKCRLDPPPNIHSPLSPQFRPNSRSSSGFSRTHSSTSLATPKRMRRGYSDHHASYSSIKRARQRQQQESSSQTQPMRMTRHQSDLIRFRDDSLDYYLEQKDIRRMQMSPTMRNSVEFIQRNSIESGRVVKVYKNGEPYEKPLRICILRGEFSTLNHLLDHINSRVLVPSGARYLFHLDGQLVYSVHELKHGSSYVVSGTRSFDFRTSEVLKDQQKREQMNRLSLEQRTLIKQQLESDNFRRPSGTRTTDHSPQRLVNEDKPSRNAITSEWVETASNCDSARSGPLKSRQPPAQTVDASQQTQKQSRLPSRKPMSFGPIGPPSPKVGAKFSGETSQRAKGLTPRNYQPQAWNSSTKPPALTRAKSEMSGLPIRKLKKNVTFKDTGRGSSPAISDLSSNETTSSGHRRTVSTATLTEPAIGEDDSSKRDAQRELHKELATSEIGIQVSNSIDGFLIDLPVALPAKGDDSNLSDRAKNRPTRTGPAGPSKAGAPSQREAAANGKKQRQIVTITERQLSNDEMSELKDLSAGDHHDHREVVIKWESPLEQEEAGKDQAELGPAEPEVVPDRTGTIPIGKDPNVGMGPLIGSGRLVTSAVANVPAGDDAHWQYPGGNAARSTPTERPVSQIGPNESVRARVTTPTPSLSTGGDNNSLTLSYETGAVTPLSIDQDGALTRSQKPRLTPSRPGQLPAKQRLEVMGKLCEGLDTPRRNFKLVWVNGFAINDLYPENSVDVQRLAESEAVRDGRTSRAEQPPAGQTRLSPSRSPGSQQQVVEFKPSGRYHNWICHSRRHDELVYPAGALIVLWCRWTNEQRYYSRHTANVSCLTLATLDLDLAASAQSADPFEKRPHVGSLIHLWRLSSLALLRVIDDDQIRPRLIFSMRLKNSKSSGCELSIAARDERQLFLVEYFSTDVNEKETVAPTAPREIEEKQKKRAGTLAMRASKLLQSNQVPLFVLRVPKLGGLVSEGAPASSQAEPLISFGRRHFNMWSADAKQRKLRPMLAEQKSARFVELIARANCLCRLSPDEFLLGDSDGNISLLLIGCVSNQGARNTAGAKRKLPPNISDSTSDLRYTNDIVELIKGAPGAKEDHSAHQSVSCLTRISGSLFMSADSTCTVRFWRVNRKSAESLERSPVSKPAQSSEDQRRPVSCTQLSSISLPPDLGFICTILLAGYNLRESVVEFYLVSTSNSILFGSVKLPQASGRPGPVAGKQPDQAKQSELLANSTLSVVYEGHETSVSGLVADSGFRSADERQGRLYFTCSLDCRICKWNGKQLIWKSMLPSSCVSLAVHPLGSVLAVGSVDGTVYILDKTSGLLISYFPLTPVRINCLAYSRDGSLLAAGCANGSIFMLPVDERGLKYRKVSIFQSPNAVVSLQFSLDNRYMLTSVSHGPYQELVLWDLPNFRYMRDDVKLAADKIQWFDSICSGSEDVRAIWENAHLFSSQTEQAETRASVARNAQRPQSLSQPRGRPISSQFVVNLSCHRLIRDPEGGSASNEPAESFVIASDTRGYLRLFQYPAYDIQQGFYAARICSSAVNCCRFLTPSANQRKATADSTDYFVSTSLDGSICLWALE